MDRQTRRQVGNVQAPVPTLVGALTSNPQGGDTMKTRAGTRLLIVVVAALAACGDTKSTGDGGSDAAALQLDASKVPEDLRSLVPLAARWGIGDDVDRNAKVDKATDAERAELKNAVDPLSSRITAWLDSFPEGAMSDEAAAFMYMQLALEEMTVGTQ
jgi:hypothetical protein